MTDLILRKHNLSRGTFLCNRETDYSKNWNNNFHTTHKYNMVTKPIIQTNWRIVMYIHKLLFTMYYSEDTEPFASIDIIQHSVSRGEEGRVKRSATPSTLGFIVSLLTLVEQRIICSVEIFTTAPCWLLILRTFIMITAEFSSINYRALLWFTL